MTLSRERDRLRKARQRKPRSIFRLVEPFGPAPSLAPSNKTASTTWADAITPTSIYKIHQTLKTSGLNTDDIPCLLTTMKRVQEDPSSYLSCFNAKEPVLERLLYPSPGASECYLLVYHLKNKGKNPEDFHDVEPVFEFIHDATLISTNYHSPCGYDTQEFIDNLEEALKNRDLQLFRSALQSLNKVTEALRLSGNFERFKVTFIRDTTSVYYSTYRRHISHTVRRAIRAVTAHSPEVYGELTIEFLFRILNELRVDKSTLLIDIGSGVANVVGLASLEYGCRTLGVENAPELVMLARVFASQLLIRSDMWALDMTTVGLEQADVQKSTTLKAVVPMADVIFINNREFSAYLNQALTDLMVNIKEGATVICTAPLERGIGVSRTAKHYVTPKGFEVQMRPFRPGEVSWTANGKEYLMVRKSGRTS